MGTVSTEAWVLHGATRPREQAQLIRETYTFPDITPNEVLVKPLYGCLEANMLHACQRAPVDICRERNEDTVVVGNAGVVVIERVGSAVTRVHEGETCIVFGNGVWDEQGYPIKIMGYDAPGTMGVLAKSMKLHEQQLIRIPAGTSHSLQQWAAFSLRYISAWANWRVAYECWQSQMRGVPPEQTIVCAWGGGVSFAQLALASRLGCRTMMVCSNPERMKLLRQAGIESIDRTQFGGDDFETEFLEAIAQRTDGKGVSIFIDNIGTPVHQITLKALARQGVVTTCGWKLGMRTHVARAIECLNRHIHVHTHYARYEEGLDAVRFAEEQAWMPPPADEVWTWDEIPAMFREYAEGRITSYFPIFAINA
ncbi:MAG: zinc-binding dehydrogenase [Planctomycetota bacterium]|nr:zinc-binding dehydrogenase [Planctomycetota bacterium]